MVGHDLPEVLKARGLGLLREVGALGLRPEGAFWLLDHDVGEWRLHVVTSLVDAVGRRETYRRLSDVQEGSVAPRDGWIDRIRVVSPRHDVLSRAIAAGRTGGGTETVLVGVSRAGITYDAVVYDPDVFASTAGVPASPGAGQDAGGASGHDGSHEGVPPDHVATTGDRKHPDDAPDPVGPPENVVVALGTFDEVGPVPGHIREIMVLNLELIAA